MSGELSPATSDARTLNELLRLEFVSLVKVQAEYLSQGGPPPFQIGAELGPVQWNRRTERIHGVFPVKVTVRFAASDGALEDYAEILVAYQVVYVPVRPLGEVELSRIPAFLRTAGWAHTWPYLRAEVQGLSTRLGLPALTLPLLLPGQAEGVPVIAAEALRAAPDTT